MAPIKAICTEKQIEWKKKFGYLNISCVKISGDTDNEQEKDWALFENSNIVCITPVSYFKL